MVCILVRGTLGILEILYQKLQQEIPAVIMKGTGSVADIIAFVYDEINAKSVLCCFFDLRCFMFIHFRSNKSYEDENLKTQFTRRLIDEYPVLKCKIMKRNEIRGRIIAIVKKNDQSRQKLLTFIDVNSSTTPLSDFYKSILCIYLQCRIF